MSTDFLTWKEVLGKLKKEGSFASLEGNCQDEWEFFDLLRKLTNNGGLCIGKSFSKSLKEDVDKYIKLINQAEEIASKYFGKKNVKLQAYYTENDNAHRVLNINYIGNNGNEPIKVSDILQQEKDISGLNICCNKKHEIHAYREGKERYYEFKEGAHYEMTSTWPVKIDLQQAETGTQPEIKSQQMDKLILNNQMLFKENVELKQEMLNLKKEAVELKQEIEAGLQVINQKHHELTQENQQRQEELETTRTENVKLNQEVAELEKQNSDLTGELAKKEEKFKKKEEKLDQLERSNKEMNGTREQLLQEVSSLKENLSYSKGITQELSDKLKNASEEKKEVNRELVEAKQDIGKLERQNGDLIDELAKKEEKFKKKMDEMRERLTQIEKDLEDKKQKLGNEYETVKDLKKKLEVANAEKDRLEDELEKLKEAEELDQEADREYKAKVDKTVQDLKSQLRKKDEEVEQLTDELKGKDKQIKGLQEEIKLGITEQEEEYEDEVDGLKDIIVDKVQTIERMNKEIKILESKVKYLEDLQNPVAGEQKVNEIYKDHAKEFYILTGDISSEPDNLPPEGEKKLSRSSSIDSGLDSDEENYDDHCGSTLNDIKSVTPIREQAESRISSQLSSY